MLCDWCQQRFTIGHALQCQHGGLVLHHHNNLAGGWHSLCAEAFKPLAVSDELKIPQYQTPSTNPAITHDDQPTTLPGGVAAHGFWTRRMAALFGIPTIDTDATLFQNSAPAKVLAKQEKDKKVT